MVSFTIMGREVKLGFSKVSCRHNVFWATHWLANGAQLIHAFAVASTPHDYGDNYFDFLIQAEKNVLQVIMGANRAAAATVVQCTSSSATSSDEQVAANK